MAGRKLRILIAKPGLDGHDRGAKYVARALKDEGYEVIYTGIRQSPESIVKTAIQEDVDFIGLSLLTGAHNELFPKVVELLKENEAGVMEIGNIFVINKKDIDGAEKLKAEINYVLGIKYLDSLEDRNPIVMVSAKNNEGIDELVNTTYAYFDKINNFLKEHSHDYKA